MSEIKKGPAIRCARCGRPAPISDEELAGDGGGDPAFLPVVAPPKGWLSDPDGEGIVDAECASSEEVTEYVNRLIAADRLTRGDSEAD